jgi:hypothetical protein
MIGLEAVRQFFAKAPALEHIGFAAYATAETTGYHNALYFVSAWLCVFGLIVFWMRDVPELKPTKEEGEK